MKRTLIFFCMSGLVLSGCSSIGSREVPKEAAPADWHSQPEKASVEAQTPEQAQRAAQIPWWTELDDPLLNQLIQEAIQSNPDVLTAQSTIREARAYRKQARGALFPTVTASGGVGSSRNHDTDVTTDTYSAVLDASWEPDVFGANRSALSAADAQELASQADYADVLITLSAEVATNYVALRGYQAQLAVTEDSLKTWRETVQLTVWQQMAGMVTQLDVEQAKRSYEQTLASIPSLRQNIIEAQYQIAVLLGRQPENLPNGLGKSAPLPLSPESVFLPMPADVLRQRPDVRAAEQRVISAMAQTDVAKANRLPSFALGGSLAWNSTNLSDLFSVGSLVSSLTAGVAQTVFDGGQLAAQVEIQQEVEQQALLSYQKTVLAALQETENALSNLHNSRETYKALERALNTSLLEEKLAIIQYEAGEANFTDVLDAQRTRLTLRKQSIEAQATELAQVITLSKAVAGNWAMKQAQRSQTQQQQQNQTEPNDVNQSGDSSNANNKP